MSNRPVTYRDNGEKLYADTCAELAQAASKGLVRLEAVARGSYPGRRLPKKAVPQLSSMGFWDAPCQQPWGLSEHCNEGIEITFLERGQIFFETQGASQNLNAGHVTITRPWQSHRIGDPLADASRLYWVILDVGVRRSHQPWRWPSWLVLSDDDREELTRMLRESEQSVWRATPDFARTFTELGRVIQVEDHTSSTSHSRYALFVNQLLLCLLDMLHASGLHCDVGLTSAERTVVMFLEELEKRLEEPWTLEAMASSAGLGRTRFSHYIHKLHNISPSQYLNSRRVGKAKVMINANPGMHLTDVALACGFSSSQYFSTVFRSLTGISPSTYAHIPTRQVAVASEVST